MNNKDIETHHKNQERDVLLATHRQNGGDAKKAVSPGVHSPQGVG